MLKETVQLKFSLTFWKVNLEQETRSVTKRSCWSVLDGKFFIIHLKVVIFITLSTWKGQNLVENTGAGNIWGRYCKTGTTVLQMHETERRLRWNVALCCTSLFLLTIIFICNQSDLENNEASYFIWNKRSKDFIRNA